MTEKSKYPASGQERLVFLRMPKNERFYRPIGHSIHWQCLIVRSLVVIAIHIISLDDLGKDGAHQLTTKPFANFFKYRREAN